MKTAISELSKNVNLLERELKQERQEIIKLSGQVSDYQLQNQIEDLGIQEQSAQIEILPK